MILLGAADAMLTNILSFSSNVAALRLSYFVMDDPGSLNRGFVAVYQKGGSRRRRRRGTCRNFQAMGQVQPLVSAWLSRHSAPAQLSNEIENKDLRTRKNIFRASKNDIFK